VHARADFFVGGAGRPDRKTVDLLMGDENSGELGQVLTKIESLDHRLTENLERLDRNINRLFERFDAHQEQGHEVRISALERRLDGFWGKVTGLVALITSVITSLMASVVWLMGLFKKAG
jgi:hypothetical protein